MPNAVLVREDKRLACQGKQPSRLFDRLEARLPRQAGTPVFRASPFTGLASRRNASQRSDKFVGKGVAEAIAKLTQTGLEVAHLVAQR